eukprot:g6199.t1
MSNRKCVFLLGVLAFLECLLIVHTEHTCDTGKYLRDCGYSTIQQPECESRGCCWNPNVPPGQPWCFNKNGGYKYCSSEKTRIDCGVYGTSENECRNRGCCWDPVGENSVTPWCFFPNTNYDTNRCPFNKRVQCGSSGTTRDSCESLGCCWSPKEDCPQEPACFLTSEKLDQLTNQIVYLSSAPSAAKTEL